MINYGGITYKVRNEEKFMKCKFCFAEVEDGVTVCPICGKALEEIEETPVEETVEIPVEETEEAPVVEEVPAKKKSKTLLVVHLQLLVGKGLISDLGNHFVSLFLHFLVGNGVVVLIA